MGDALARFLDVMLGLVFTARILVETKSAGRGDAALTDTYRSTERSAADEKIW